MSVGQQAPGGSPHTRFLVHGSLIRFNFAKPRDNNPRLRAVYSMEAFAKLQCQYLYDQDIPQKIWHVEYSSQEQAIVSDEHR